MDAQRNEMNQTSNVDAVYNFKVWKHKQNTTKEDILGNVDKDKNNIQQETALICENKRNTITTTVQSQRTHMGHSKSTHDFTNVSQKAQKMLKEIYSKMKSMKDSTNEIKELNALYLYDTTNKCVEDPHQKNNLHKSASLPDIKLAKVKQIKNFTYVTDNYRKQLNKAFMKFNPMIHLENLKLLQEADPDIKNDIEQLDAVIEQDIKEITHKHYYRNRYKQRAKKMVNKSNDNEVAMKINDDDMTGMTKSATLVPTLSPGHKKNAKAMTYVTKPKNTSQGDQKKKFPLKEIRLGEMECMKNAIKVIGDVITDKNINANITAVFNKDKRGIKQEPYEDYRDQYVRIENSLKDVMRFKIKKSLKDENHNLNANNKENEAYIVKLPMIKEKLLKDLDFA